MPNRRSAWARTWGTSDEDAPKRPVRLGRAEESDAANIPITGDRLVLNRVRRGEDEEGRAQPSRYRHAPPALLSLLSHLLMLWIFLFWILIPDPDDDVDMRIPIQIKSDIEGNTDEEEAEDEEEPAEEAAQETHEEIPEEEQKHERAEEVEEVPEEVPEENIGLGGKPPEEKPPVENPDPEPPVLDDDEVLDALEASERAAERVAPVFGARNSDGRAAGVGKFGGSESTEAAVEMGLEWLSRHQSADGRWDSNHFNQLCPISDRCRGSGLMSYDTAQSGLALLCFLGAGYLPEKGDYGDEVARAIEFLLQEQRATGLFGGGDLYNHAISTFALAEAYGMTREPRLKRAVQAGIAYLAEAQQPGGGWSYTASPKHERNDSSITGFAVMALKAAHVSGIRVPEHVFAGAIRHFRRMTDPRTGVVQYANRGPQFARQGEGLVAVGAFSRLVLGQPHGARIIELSRERLAANPPDASRHLSERHQLDNSMYYWYYGTLASFMLGGRHWNEWNREMVRTLVPRQKKAGHQRGSWDPTGKWGPNGGRLYATTTCILTLEIYYKYAPEYLRQMPDLTRYWMAPIESGDEPPRRGR